MFFEWLRSCYWCWGYGKARVSGIVDAAVIASLWVVECYLAEA